MMKYVNALKYWLNLSKLKVSKCFWCVECFFFLALMLTNSDTWTSKFCIVQEHYWTTFYSTQNITSLWALLLWDHFAMMVKEFFEVESAKLWHVLLNGQILYQSLEDSSNNVRTTKSIAVVTNCRRDVQLKAMPGTCL